MVGGDEGKAILVECRVRRRGWYYPRPRETGDRDLKRPPYRKLIGRAVQKSRDFETGVPHVQ